MEFKNERTISPEVRGQLQKLVDLWKSQLGDALIGVYVHGSLALGCFLEETSDLDVLIVTNRRMEREERLILAEAIIALDGKPCPLEMSAIFIGDLSPWQHPVACQFHYSDYWTAAYRSLLNGELQTSFIVDEEFKDEDLTSYIHLLNQCGICLYGEPIGKVFPPVPESDFWQAISAGVENYDFHAYNPRYFVSNILILGRVLSYKKEQRILSKYEGGQWTSRYVPERLRYIVDHALKVWYEGEEPAEYPQADLEELRSFLIGEILK
ncbi:aminoglycoside adenylyltransferase domain-containing protein [Gorillibacterium sp. sgz500922]|uniref:aminoglycoside adenylyltransferase domain-containing protein n=1 Tax=Gorillibacterium sp. sgz500922 TaxID=3446694 RepID=UPI003F665D47